MNFGHAAVSAALERLVERIVTAEVSRPEETHA
jgi:hypothetical protein